MRRRRTPRIEELEPRILYAADMAALAPAAGLLAPADQRLLESPATQDAAALLGALDALAAASPEARAEATTAPAQVTTHHEIVFIDAAVTQADVLAAALPADARLVWLDASRDGLKQISEALAGEHDLAALHLVSHGAPGQVRLGSLVLDRDTLAARATELQGWAAHLAAGADLLIYGCDVAGSADGQALMAGLRELTGADVAASLDRTGAAADGGNWQLESRLGEVQADWAATHPGWLGWQGSLATFTVTSSADTSTTGTLRWAIEQANANGTGLDTINFSGVSTINLTALLPQITGQVTINGASVGGTPGVTINGGNARTIGLQLVAGSDNSVIRGLVLQNFTSRGLFVVGASNVTIAGNYIGTDSGGNFGAGNNVGIDLFSAAGAVVGGSTPADRNVISGNSNIGLNITGAGSTGIVVKGNYIGTGAGGTSDVGNTNHGIYVDAASGVTIGGTGAGEGNVISGQNFAGLTLGANATGITVLGNLIGLNSLGTGTIPNSSHGIWIQGANNTIGGTATGARNVISGNGVLGIRLSGASATGNTILGNYIGTGTGGTTDLGNGEDGIQLDTGASNNTIGGTSTAARNIIGGNNNAGIALDDPATTGNIILGNWIGAGADGSTQVANSHNGIHVNGATGTLIGDGTAAGRNVIAGNSLSGIGIIDAAGTVVAGNWIVYNLWDGITVYGNTADTVIGGTSGAAGNLIAHNTSDGIMVRDSTGSATILANSVYANGQRGIDLADNGYDTNDLNDTDSGANGLQNYPVLTSAASATAGTTVVGSLNSAANTSYRIDVYTNRPGDVDGSNGEGARWVSSFSTTTNGSGVANFNNLLSNAWINQGDRVTATATRIEGDGSYGVTSEFAANITGSASGVVVVDTTSDSYDAGVPSGTVTIGTLGGNRGGDGRISLREAMHATNNTGNGASADRIVFAIPPNIESLNYNTASVVAQTIRLGSLLPTVSQAVVIDASTDASFAANGNRPAIVLSGDTNNDGTADIQDGLRIWGATSGGSTVRGLVVQRFTQDGIDIASSNGNTVAGNWIGLDTAGTAAAGNQQGVNLWNSSGNTVGGTGALDGNVISGNTGQGVYIGTDNGSGGSNLVVGNRIGTNAAGTAAVGNLSHGILLSSAGNTVGGTSGAARNIISANAGAGVYIVNAAATGNVVVGNYIGTDLTGTVDLNGSGQASGASGVVVTSSASGNRIGTNADGSNDAAERNIISGNNWYGVEFLGTGTTGNVAQGNYIGTDVSGQLALGNSGGGVSFWGGASGNRAGGGASGAGNVISGNLTGVLLAEGVSTNRVQGNLIGLAADGSTALGNTGAGVYFYNGGTGNAVTGNFIGTDGDGSNDAAERNVISANVSGVALNNAQVSGNTVAGNYIGTDASGTLDRGNSGSGVLLQGGATGNSIGGGNAGQGNLLSGNDGRGIQVDGASGNVLQGNLIGLQADGSSALGNTFSGIYLHGGAANNLIGGTTTGQGNRIAFSGQPGVALGGDAGNGNAILGNAIFSNGGASYLGINLSGGSENAYEVTANDASDADTGANDLQNYPVLAMARTDASGQVVVTGSIASAANSHYRIEFFANTTADASGHGEGQTYLGFVNMNTGASGQASFNRTLAATVPVGGFISATATATDASFSVFGSTSEFSANVAAMAPNLAPQGSDALVTTLVDTAYTFSAANFGFSDSDGSSLLQVRIDTLPAAGTLRVFGTPISAGSSVGVAEINAGWLTYQPPAGTTGTTSFIFRVQDDGGTALGGSDTDASANTMTVRTAATINAPDGVIAVPNVPAANLVGIYGFNRAADLGHDDANGGANATFSGSPGQVLGPAGGSALGLAGGASGQYGDIAGITTGGAMTVSAWVRFDTTGNWQRVFDFGEVNSTGVGSLYVGRLDGSNDLTFTTEKDLGGGTYAPFRATASNAIVQGQWMHFTATVDASGQMALYVNGILKDTENGTALNVAVRSHNYIGKSNWAPDVAFGGAIDNLVILNGAVSAQQAAALYQQTSGFTVSEGAANGTAVATVRPFDLDSGDTFTYSLTDSAGGRFAIGADGTLTVADGSRLDFEAASTHGVTVRVTDSAGLWVEQVLTIGLSDVANAPVLNVPVAQSTNEDTPRVFSSAGGNAITLANSDSTGALNELTLSVDRGSLTLARTTGLVFVTGDGSADATMTLRGTLADINAALDGLAWQPAANDTAGATLSLAAADASLVRLNLDAALLGRYTFDGSAADVGPGTAQDATLVNGAAFVTDGSRGQVLALDGVDDHAQIAGTFGNPNEVTIGGWVNLAAGSGRREFVSLDNRVHIALDEAGIGVKGSVQVGPTSWVDLTSGQFIAGTGWHHVMYSFSDTSNTHALYIDGVQVASATINASIDWAGAGNTFIGRHPTVGLYPQARVDDVRIFNRVVSAAEVAALAQDQALSPRASVAVAVTAINDAPAFSALDGTPTYAEGAVAVVLDADVAVSDIDLDAIGHYAGATLTLSRFSGASTEDAFAATGTLGALTQGSALTVGATTIGTVTQNSLGTLQLSFNASATGALVNQAMRQIGYQNLNNAPPASVQVRWQFSDGNAGAQGTGGASSVLGSTTVTIAAVNDAPVFVSLDGTPTHVEGDLPTVIDADLSIFDHELGSADNFTGATFTLQRSGGANAQDQFGATGTLGFLATGGAIVVGGNTVGTVLQNANGLLSLSFSAGATEARVNAVLRQITYRTLSDTPPASVLLAWNFNDGNTGAQGSGGGLAASGSTVVTITATDDPSVVSNLQGDALSYTAGSGAVVIDQGAAAVVTDVDSTDFDTGSVVVNFQSGSDSAEDVLAVRHQGNGAGQIGVSGNAVSYGGTLIGSLAGGSGGASLVLSLNANADAAAVSALLRNLSFQNTDAVDPTSGARSVRVIVFDGDGGASAWQLVTVTVQPANTVPVFSGLDGTPTYTEGAAAVVLDADVQVLDTQLATAGHYAGATLTLARQGGANAQDVFSATGTLAALVQGQPLVVGGVGVGTVTTLGGGTLVLSFDANATQARVNAVLRQIGYSNTSDAPPASVTLDWRFDDGNTGAQGTGGALAANGSSVVTIAAVNDAPSGTGRTVTLAEDASHAFSAADFGFSDVDGHALQSVTITTLPAAGRLQLAGVDVAAGQAIAVADLVNLRFLPQPDGSGTPYTSFSFQVTDDGGSANGGVATDPTPDTFGFDVTPFNDAPVLGLGGTNLVVDGSFEGGGTGWSSNSGLEVSNLPANYGAAVPPDGARFAEVEGFAASGVPSWLEQTLTTQVGQTYVLSLAASTRNDAGTADMGLLSVDGVELDRFTTGTAWQRHAVLFTATGTSTTIRITSLGSQTSTTSTGAGNSGGLLVDDVRVTAVDGSASYTEDGTATVLASGGIAFDAELGAADDHAGATLTLLRHGGASALDQFSATGTLAALTTGNSLVVGGVAIGTVAQNGAGTLVLNFGSGATADRVNAVLRQIAYSHGGDDPPASVQIDWTFSDGNAGAQGAGGALTTLRSTLVTLTAVNDVPVNTLPATMLGTEDQTLVLSGLSIADPDAGSSLLTTTLSVTQGSLAATGTGGVTVTGSGTGTLVLEGTLADLNAFLAGSAPTLTLPADANGTLQLSMVTRDGLDTGSGGVLAANSLDYRFHDGTPAGFDAANVPTTGGQTGVATAFNISTLANTYTGSTDSFSLVYHGTLEITGAGSYSFTVAADDRAKLYIDGALVVDAAYTGGTSAAVVLGAGQHRLELRFFEDTGGQGLDVSYSGPDTSGAPLALFSSPAVGRLVSATASSHITFAPVNDAPVVTASGASLAYAENAGPLALDPLLGVSDVDGAPLAGAQVRIVSGYRSGEDRLVFSNQLGISGSWNAGTGVLTLSGAASVADYQAALRSVAYENTSDTPDTTPRSVGFLVGDGLASSAEAVVGVTVSALNDLPQLDLGSPNLVYTENAGPQRLAPAATAGDLDAADFNGGSLTVWFSANGLAEDRLSVLGQGNGPGQIGVAAGVVSWQGTAIGSVSGGTDGSTPLVVLFNAQADAAAVQALLRRLAYENVSDDPSTAVRSLAAQLDDGDGGLSPVAGAQVTPVAVNDAPVGQDGVALATEDQTYVLGLADFGFSDAEADALLGVRIATLPSPGNLQLNGVAVSLGQTVSAAAIGAGQLRYTPPADAFGLGYASLSFQVQDAGGTANGGIDLDPTPRTLRFDIASVNDAPHIVSAGGGATADLATAENLSLVTTVVAADVDGPAAVYSLAGGADAARFQIDANTGSLSFLAAPDFEAPQDASADNVYEVVVQASDGQFAATQALRITVGNVNEGGAGPVADSDAAVDAVDENAALGTVVGVTAHASDIDAVDTISYALTDDAGGRFAIDPSTGVVTVAGAIDREAAASLALTVRATSTDGSWSSRSFTIAINDVDEFDTSAVTDADAAANAVDENAAVGTVVGLTAFASDDDATHSAVTYALTDDAGGRFAIDANTGVVTVAGAIDREATASLGITVRATSADGSFSEQAFTIAVNDVDEFDTGAIADSDAAANSVDENAAAGTVVGITAQAGDADATNHVVTYALTEDAGGRFAIDAGTGVVTVAGAIDREAAASHGITVRATSADGSFSTQAFTIVVNDVDEFDTGAIADSDAAANAVDENATIGAVVGLTAFASDADATNHGVSYTLDDDAGGRFAIDAGTGIVTVAGAIDREAAASHAITVRATSADGSFSTQVFTIAVNDMDEFDTSAIADSDATADAVNENAAAGTVVGLTGFAGDGDATNHAMSYSLDDDAGGRFAIDAGTGIVTVAGAIDREAAASHGITVRATSADGSISTRAFTIAVNDVDEFVVGAVADTDAAGDAVNENAAVGTVVGLTALAVDADATNHAVTYALDNDAGGRFAIDAGTGIVTVAGDIDREAAASHTLTVRATSADGSFSTQAFTIAVNDLDEFDIAAVTDTDAANNAVDENAAAGTVAGLTAFASDADATNHGVSYTLDDDAGGRFAIDAGTGVVTVAGAIDREAAASHDITVRATSADGSFSTQAFTIVVNDVDEFDTGALTDSDAAANVVDENAAAGTVVGLTGFAGDGDATNHAVTYALADDAGGRFAIDATTGVVTVAGAIDREAAASHGITVRATSSDGSFSTQAFTITVNDVDEFDTGALTDSDADANAVNENAAAGTVVGLTGFARDGDATNHIVTYALADDAGGRFAIDAHTGVVTVAGAIDREAAASHTVTVRATSADGSSSTQAFTVTVNDLDEFDVDAQADTDAGAEAVLENAAPGTLVGLTAHAVDADATGARISYRLVDDAGGRFAIDAATGVVSVAGAIDREAAAEHQITVRADSEDGSFVQRDWRIQVLGVNDNTPELAGTDGNGDLALTITENLTAVDTLQTLDADLPAQDLRVSIVGGDDAALLQVDAVTGALSFRAAPDHEAPADADGDNRYRITVQVSDGERLRQQQVVIGVTDANDAPEVMSVPGVPVVLANQGFSYALPASMFRDADVGDTLVVSIVDGPAWLQWDAASQRLTGTAGTDALGPRSVILRATDGAGAWVEARLTVTVAAAGDTATPPTTTPPDTPAPATPPAETAAPTAASADPARPTITGSVAVAAAAPAAAGNDAAVAPNLDGWLVPEASPTGAGRSGTGADRPADDAGSPLARRDGNPAVAPTEAVIDASQLLALFNPAGDNALLSTLVAGPGGHGRGATAADGTELPPGTQLENLLLSATPAQATVAVLSAGFVWWALRAAGLVATVLASTPVWRHLDPIPILGAGDDEEEDDSQGLQDADGSDAGERARDEAASRELLDDARRGAN